MGFQPGKGLGKDLQGISTPVEAHLRKGRGAIGMFHKLSYWYIYLNTLNVSNYYKRKTWKGKIIKNMLTRNSESDTYLATVSGHCWSKHHDENR